jgi:hypothetical protein
MEWSVDTHNFVFSTNQENVIMGRPVENGTRDRLQRNIRSIEEGKWFDVSEKPTVSFLKTSGSSKFFRNF